ncbi:MAG: flagellar hook-basal body complex protein [Nitrospirota bacterium]
MPFNSNGALQSVTTTSDAFNFSGGAAQGQSISFDFGDDIASGGTGYKGSTQFGSDSATTFQGQDGYAAGSLESVSINSSGTVVGSFTNGQTQNMAVLALANFPNPTGLTKESGGIYQESTSSGQPLVGQPGKSGLGSINADSLELSNTDLASEFVNLITYERGFQANSKIITTVDQMLSDVVNLKQSA